MLISKYAWYKILQVLLKLYPEAIGLFFVLKTFLSNSLSDISFTIHPAELIKIEPKKNKIKKKK